jgi:hypothetical protein
MRALAQRLVIPFLLLSPYQALAQTTTAESTKPQQATLAIPEPYQGGWSVSGDAAKEEVESKDPESLANTSARHQLDLIRWQRNTSLARHAGEVPSADQAQLETLALDLNTAAPNSFEAHMANYYMRFPAPSAFQELKEAAEKDGTREELIGPRLVDAARTGEQIALVSCAKDMKARGRIAPALYQVAQDLLASVEPGSVLFAAGEMDAYPLWVEQYANGRSRDVLVVDARLLADNGYRARIWALAKARGPVPAESGFIAALGTASTRPVQLSLALGTKVLAPLKDRLFVTGVALRLSNAPFDNLLLLEERWEKLKKPLNAGPFSQNYLVPGSVLLAHYRAVGDESRASRMEHELRRMAEQLGATGNLLRSGVLSH